MSFRSRIVLPVNVLMNDLISELLISVSVKIILWCFSCLIEIRNNYSRFLSGLDVYFTDGHQPYFKYVTHQ